VVIEGQKIFTTGAQNCQYSFLLTRTHPDAVKHKGLTMFLCPLDEAEIRPIHTLGGERTNMVFYDSIRIRDRYRLGPVDQGWTVLLGPLNAEHALGDGDGAVTLEEPGGM
jgi:alkylation response protein AidB-like acyl-CoA dehydrogenase